MRGAAEVYAALAAKTARARPRRASPGIDLTRRRSEKDLETAILMELERFLLELGRDFALVARQNHTTVGNEDCFRRVCLSKLRLRLLLPRPTWNWCALEYNG